MRRWVEGARFTPQFKKKRWDGYIRPGTWTRDGKLALGRGLLERVLQDLKATITVPPPTSPSISLDAQAPILAELRDYQREALQTILTKRWGCIALATNAGKGAIIALAAKAISSAGQVLICCDEISVFQALEEEIFKWAHLRPAIISAGRYAPPGLDEGPIVLAMIPTLYRRIHQKVTDGDKVTYACRPVWKEWLEGINAVFLDEADKVTSSSWQWVLKYLPNTHFRIGTSGTFPTEETVDELTIHESIGPIRQQIKNIDLVERGISARPTVEMCPYEHYISKPKDWKEMSGPEKRLYIYEQGVVLNEERHEYIKGLLEPGVSNAVVVNYLNHGRELARVLPDSQFISGDDSLEVRQTALERFKSGEIKTLIVSKILDRGTNDLGHAVGLIFASAQGSDRQTLQRIGRGLRRTDGKRFLFLKDIVDRGHRYFETASVRRVELYNAEGFAIRIRTLSDPMITGVSISVRTHNSDKEKRPTHTM